MQLSSPEDIAELKTDVAEECSQFGKVLNVFVPSKGVRATGGVIAPTHDSYMLTVVLCWTVLLQEEKFGMVFVQFESERGAMYVCVVCLSVCLSVCMHVCMYVCVRA